MTYIEKCALFNSPNALFSLICPHYHHQKLLRLIFLILVFELAWPNFLEFPLILYIYIYIGNRKIKENPDGGCEGWGSKYMAQRVPFIDMHLMSFTCSSSISKMQFFQITHPSELR